MGCTLIIKLPCSTFVFLKHDNFLQKEKEKLHERIMEMEAKLNEKQELELEIEKLKGTTNVMKHMVGSEGDADIVEKMARTQIELEARETALHNNMSSLAQKERVTNDEYQDARKEMIQVQNKIYLKSVCAKLYSLLF